MLNLEGNKAMPGKKQSKNDPLERQARMPKHSVPSALVPYLILAAIFILFSYVRIRLASFPLERDEGGYAYFGRLILHGIPPYQQAYDIKFPGIFAVYALIMAVFGQTAQGIRHGLLVFDLGSLAFIFLIMKRMFSKFSALAAVAVAAILFTSPDLLGQAAHATHFVAFFMLAGSWLLLEGMEKRRWPIFLLAGVMMGLSLLIKQSGIFFPLFGGAVVIAGQWLRKERKWTGLLAPLLPYTLGIVVPLLLMVLTLFLCGVFDRFWFWTSVYPKFFGSRVPLSWAWTSLAASFSKVLHAFPAAWILAAFGGVALSLYRGKPFERLFLGLLLIFSFLAVIPGFFFRPHYFIPMAAAVGMLAGFFLEYLNLRIGPKFRRIPYVTGIVFVVLVIAVLNGRKHYFFQADPVDLCRELYAGNYFAEAVPVADYIKANTKVDDRILVFGSEPEIYFYSGRRSVTPYIFLYDLAYPHPYVKAMQKDLMSEVEKAKPKIIVIVSCDNSWMAMGGASDALFTWMDSYARQHNYLLAGLVEYYYPEPSDFFWGDDTLTHKPKTQNYMYILERRE